MVQRAHAWPNSVPCAVCPNCVYLTSACDPVPKHSPGIFSHYFKLPERRLCFNYKADTTNTKTEPFFPWSTKDLSEPCKTTITIYKAIKYVS